MTASVTSSPLNILLASHSRAGRGVSSQSNIDQLRALQGINRQNNARNAQNAQNTQLGNGVTASPNNTRNSQVSQSLAAESQSVQLQARSLSVRASPNATLTTQYGYDVGPDGQLYVTSVTVTSTQRVQGRGNAASVPGASQLQNNNSRFNEADAQGRHIRNLAELLNPRTNLSPSEEVQLFTSERFAEAARASVDGINRGRLQVADFGVRAQETQHFRAGGGTTSLPEYGYQTGPDGELYAISGSVGIATPPAADAETAARNSQTIANAALAATDVSAQDISTARNAQADAAAQAAAARRQAQVSAQYQQQSDLIFTTNPVFDAAA